MLPTKDPLPKTASGVSRRRDPVPEEPQRRWGVRIAAALLLCALWIGGWYLREPVFVGHLFTYPYRAPITKTRWYAPKERVKGRSSAALPLASKAKREFLKKALGDAIAYAKSSRSVALLVLHKGEIALEKYWRGFTRSSRSNSMSMAKTLVALLVGAAIADGHIGSERDFAARYLPAWRRDRRKQIRISHLLQMHSGLRGDGRRRSLSSDLTRLYFGPDIRSYLWTIPALEPPGRRFLYKDADSQILGALLERATGRRFAHYLSQKLWQPLGAPDAFVWLDRPQGMAHTTCCVFTTARAWARVGMLLMHKGKWKHRQLISKAWIKKMLTPSPDEPEYGFLLWLRPPGDRPRTREYREPFLAPDLFYLDGLFQQRVYVLPSAQLVIVRIGERVRWQRWDESRLPNSIARGIFAWEWQRKPRR